eukprot:12888614-Prorocentrum_lima.AAC.1
MAGGEGTRLSGGEWPDQKYNSKGGAVMYVSEHTDCTPSKLQGKFESDLTDRTPLKVQGRSGSEQS